MKICTWNSQGNPLNDAIKLNILNHLLTTEQCNVVMIQECGNFILPAQHSGRHYQRRSRGKSLCKTLVYKCGNQRQSHDRP